MGHVLWHGGMVCDIFKGRMLRKRQQENKETRKDLKKAAEDGHLENNQKTADC